MNILTEYPIWFSFFCLFAGVLYAFVLYRNDKKFADLNAWIIRGMAMLRFFVVTILCFLLLNPLLKTTFREVEKPIIIFAQDNSESIIAGSDSLFYKKQYKEKVNTLLEKLKGKYDVKSYSFADNIKEFNVLDSLHFNEKQTDFSLLFSELETRYANRNVGAIILASDGLYNRGFNPVYASSKFTNNIYTIALGDTTIKKDIVLLKVEHNRLAYLGNKFPLQVVINAKRLKGKTTTLTISKSGNILFSQVVTVNSDTYTLTVPVLLEAKEVGLQKYTLTLSAVPDEMSVVNNKLDVFIDVLDARQKVLILADAPHPDVAAIKESIEANQNYEVESYTLDNFDKPLKKYNLVILHLLPNFKNSASKIVNELIGFSIPVWLFSGANTILKNNLTIASSTQRINEIEPVLDQNFSLFTLSEDFRKSVKDFPAVVSPFGNVSTDNNASAFMYQRIGVVDTKTPLMTFSNSTNTKVALFYGEGIWKWRLQDYAAHGSHQLFDEFVSKTVQYLSVKENKSFFRVFSKTNFFENQSIELDAELYNESYELINTPDVDLAITNFENKKFPFAFNRTMNAYHANVGSLPVGDYKYEAKTKVGDKLYNQKGSFSVSALQIELTNTVADHQLLYALASNHDGEMVYPQTMETLADKLMNRQDIVPVSFTEKKLTDLISLKWILFLIVLLLALEWFIRKRNGAY
ncbi:MAG: hypothetical protein JNL69_12910 [Bacteroidia bacterium]|nr:hypothetical protein [Bacteroidia bacterium]